MKLELPVAILLLAGGCYLWTTQGDRLLFAPKTVENTASSDLDATDLTSTNSSQRHASNVLANVSTNSNTSNIVSTSGNQAETGSRAETNSQSEKQSPNELLWNASRSVLNSPPIQTSAQLKIDLFGQQFSADGQYFQRGQGMRHARLEFEYQIDDDQIATLTQICDGRFYFCSHETPTNKELQYFELKPLVEADRYELAANPSSWMATGGLSSLLGHLAQSFEFEPPEKIRLGGIATIRLRGVWKQSALKNILLGQIESAWLHPNIQWHRLPKQLPHAVEIHLGTDEFLPLFPYQIRFLQFPEPKKAESNSSSKTTVDMSLARPIVTLRFSDVAKIESLPDSYFIMRNEGADRLINLTEQYASRIDELSETHRTAQKESTQTSR